MRIPRGPLVRAALVILAIGVIAWAAVLARDARLQNDALAGANAHPGAAAFRASARALARASLWSADSQSKIYLAGIELLLGRARRALALADQVVASEPDNLDAWRMVALAGARAAPRRAAVARARIVALDPLSAQR
jgi:hypothetical protein